MPSCSTIDTRSRFERRLPSGKHDLIFKVSFGSYSAAARHFNVRRMTVWRWRHGKAPLPKRVAVELAKLVHEKVEETHDAERQLRDFLALASKPPRPLSGCCAGFHRRVRNPVTATDWAPLGD
jgi:hypothetical protein